ncbi:MAG: PKD domain-containing protein, partial [Bacteroidota bacterium]
MKKILFSVFVFATVTAMAQIPYSTTQLNGSEPEWVVKMFDSTTTPADVADLYEAYYTNHDFVKNFYTQYYKHWMMRHARDNDGALFNQTTDENKFNENNYLLHSQQQAASAVLWECIGPFDFDHHAASTSYAPGAAHVYTVEQSFSDPNTLYAGTANAGVWKSIDKGEHWNNLTIYMMLSQVRALEIDFTDPNIVYFSGAGKIYKTTDGGLSWNATGSSTFQSSFVDANDMMMSTVNHNELWAATGTGLWHTTDGGANWIQIMIGIWQELEVNPGDANIMYAIKQTGVKTEFYKSTDAGQTFTIRLGGYPVALSPNEQKRTEISVTPAAPDIIYAFATGVANAGAGLYGIYVSHDAGENWSFQCCGTGPGGVPDTSTNKNLCGWDDHGGDDGGQYYYDLALCVSPFDSNEVHVGAVNHWVSHDAGVTWNCPAKWSHSDKPMYVHADIHDIKFYNNNWWIACDGGIFYSASLGDTFTKKQNGIAGTDFWGFGMGEWDGDEVMVGGTYHNGTQLKDNHVYDNDWMSTMGGDNILGAVNYAEPNIIFSDYGRHQLSHDRTVDLQNIGAGMLPSESYITGENGDLDFNPRVWGKVYIGRDSSIWISEDNGLSYQLLHSWGSGKITSIEIAPSNPDVIYACYYQSYNGAKKLYKSTDAGSTWADVTPAASVFNNASSSIPFDIAVSSTNENELWLVRTQQSSQQSNLNGYKVFKTTDGGNSWQNLTTVTLDGEYITCIEHQRGTNGGVYIGTRRTVYYRNNLMSDWLLYNSGLPASNFSTQIQIDYKDQKVVNAGNRSVWEAPLYEPSTVQALISVDKNIVHCTRDTVYFDDHSNMADLNPSWSWSFPGGNPSSSNLRNPKVVYESTGVYGVTLTVTNTAGTSTQVLDSFISVYNECVADTVPGNCLSLDGGSGVASGGALNLNSNHVTLSAWIKPMGTQNDWSG